jgi:Na+-translocating ferredoxin:NAD+ oxidoreductase RNF subunit RnfB
MKSALNRRGLFALLGRPLQRTMEPSPGEVAPSSYSHRASQNQQVMGAPGTVPASFSPQIQRAEAVLGAPAQCEVVAVIQGRRCIALTSFCAVCVERCPVPGAMQVMNGMPSVVPDACTGCGICQQVCPAPTNAVLMLPRRKPSRLATISTATL